ncbi:MAG: thioredoxin family protein [Phycisphaerae bacterium]|nr:thioredoxin family protein [Phycisphaerae bacterium]
MKAQKRSGDSCCPVTAAPTAGQPQPAASSGPATQASANAGPLPRLVDLGADKCVPCKMMAPILEELGKTHRDKFEVLFIDVWKDKQAGEKYGIRVIPTQIFYDADGKERFRHEGFFSKEDILAKWKELGVEIGGATTKTDGR